MSRSCLFGSEKELRYGIHYPGHVETEGCSRYDVEPEEKTPFVVLLDEDSQDHFRQKENK